MLVLSIKKLNIPLLLKWWQIWPFWEISHKKLISLSSKMRLRSKILPFGVSPTILDFQLQSGLFSRALIPFHFDRVRKCMKTRQEQILLLGQYWFDFKIMYCQFIVTLVTLKNRHKLIQNTISVCKIHDYR